MGFNLGALAGGAADGWSEGSRLQNDALARALTQQQITEYQNNQAAQQAFANMLYPGATPMPSSGGPGMPAMPAISRVPVIGDIFSGVKDFFGGGSGGGAPGGGAPPGAKPPAGDQQPYANPAPQPQAQAAPAPQAAPPGLPPQVQAVAAAIDKANPGLRQSNPRAFSQAVMLGMKQVQDYAGLQMEQAKNKAEIGSKEADIPLKQSQAEMYRKHGDLYDARAANPTPGKTQEDVVRRQITDKIKANEVQMRHYENLISKELNGFMPSSAQTQARVIEYKKYVDAYRAQNDMLTKQLPPIKTTPTTTESVQASEVTNAEPPAAKQAKLEPFVNHLLSIQTDPIRVTKFVKALQAEGIPASEITYMMKRASARAQEGVNSSPMPNAAPNIPLVPQGQ